MHFRCYRTLVGCFSILALLTSLHSMFFAQPSRIAQRIDTSRRFTMRGQLQPLARSAYDQGRADSTCNWSASRLY